MGDTVRGYKGAAVATTLTSVAEVMSAHFRAQQIVDLIILHVQEEQKNNDLEEEAVFEEEDGEEYNSEHNASSSHEEIPQGER